MIFRNTAQLTHDGQRFTFFNYVPVRYHVDDGGVSKAILDYKNKSEYMIENFARHLNNIMGEGFAIAVMPSSDAANNYNSASHDTARRLIRKAAAEGRIIYDASRCLTRVKSVTPQHISSGRRDEQTHLDSIEVHNAQTISDRTVVVLDDIYTTGKSFKAASKLLKAAGAAKVVCVTLGRTLRKDEVEAMYGVCV